MIDLGRQPLANALKATAADALSAERFPLAVIADGDVYRLSHEVAPEILFRDYVYRSSAAAPFREHCRQMWSVVRQWSPRTVIDVGGNDGTLLSTFTESDGRAPIRINVDIGDYRAENAAHGIAFVEGLWGQVQLDTKADVIVSTNVFQHTRDVHAFLAAIRTHLDGHWVLEFPYWIESLRTAQFDQIYHEHYYYWTVTPLRRLFREYGLTIVSVTPQQIHGGSLRIIATNHAVPEDPAVATYVAAEQQFDTAAAVAHIRDRITGDAACLAALPGTRAGFGAAAKGTVYLNATGAGSLLEYVVDDTPQKQGKFIPGTALQVVDRTRLLSDPPDTLVILAHNYADAIAALVRPTFRGRIVAMLPEFREL